MPPSPPRSSPAVSRAPLQLSAGAGDFHQRLGGRRRFPPRDRGDRADGGRSKEGVAVARADAAIDLVATQPCLTGEYGNGVRCNPPRAPSRLWETVTAGPGLARSIRNLFQGLLGPVGSPSSLSTLRPETRPDDRRVRLFAP